MPAIVLRLFGGISLRAATSSSALAFLNLCLLRSFMSTSFSSKAHAPVALRTRCCFSKARASHAVSASAWAQDKCKPDGVEASDLS